MPKPWGKTVQSMRKQARKSRGWFSPESNQLSLSAIRGRVKLHFTHTLFPTFSQHLSPLKNVVSPLFEHYFYPLSTAPTINSIKEIKER